MWATEMQAISDMLLQAMYDCTSSQLPHQARQHDPEQTAQDRRPDRRAQAPPRPNQFLLPPSFQALPHIRLRLLQRDPPPDLELDGSGQLGAPESEGAEQPEEGREEEAEPEEAFGAGAGRFGVRRRAGGAFLGGGNGVAGVRAEGNSGGIARRVAGREEQIEGIERSALLFVDGAVTTPIGRRGRGSTPSRRFVFELGSVERGFAAGCSGSTEMEFRRWCGQVHLLKVWRSTRAQLKVALREGGSSVGSHAVRGLAGWRLEAGRRVEVLRSGRMEEEATPSA